MTPSRKLVRRHVPPRAMVEHVADGLELHAEALREGTVGTPGAQARWLDIQAEIIVESASRRFEEQRSR